jgi:hypothetical protein
MKDVAVVTSLSRSVLLSSESFVSFIGRGECRLLCHYYCVLLLAFERAVEAY